jgi:WD40 repeat protein
MRGAAAATAIMMLGALPYALALREATQKSQQAERADREAAHARKAEAEARDQLWLAYLAEAQALRLGGRVGRRFEALEVLNKAAAIRPSLPLRNEAIACLALSDLRTERVWGSSADGATLNNFDDAYQHYALIHTNGLVTIHLVADDREVLQIPGFEAPLPGYGPMVEFSHDDSALAVASGARMDRVEVWSLGDKHLIQRWEGRFCRTLAFSRDSRRLALSFTEPDEAHFPVLIYGVAERRVLTTFDHQTLPYWLSFRPGKNELATSSTASSDVLIWDLAACSVRERLPHPLWVRGIDWDPTGNQLATACADGSVGIWDMAESGLAVKRRQIIATHERDAIQVSYSFDGSVLASGGYDYIVQFSEAKSQRPVLRATGSLAHGFGLEAHHLFMRRLRDAAGVYEFEPSRICRTLRGQTPDRLREGRSCDYSPDGKLLLVAHADGVRVWDLKSGAVVGFQPENDVSTALFEPSSSRCLTSSDSGVKEWGLPDRRRDSHAGLELLRRLSPLAAGEMALGVDGARLAFFADGGLHLMTLREGLEARVFDQTGRGIHMAFGPRGELAVAVGNVDTELIPAISPVKIFDSATRALVKELPQHVAGRVAFSPDSKWLLVGDILEYCCWDTEHWTVRYTIPKPGKSNQGIMRFSPDSSIAALAVDADTVRLVATNSGDELAALQPPESHEIMGLEFSPDGRELAVIDVSGLIHLWDLRALRTELAKLKLDWAAEPPR